MNPEQETLINRLDEAGLSLRRFIIVGEDKAPREPSEWQNNLRTPDELNGSPAWGIVGREGLVLIDTDDEETAKYIGENLPHTFVSVSPRRQLPHFYYAVDGGEVPNRVLKLPGETKGGGEIRAQNQYLVAPGSEVKWGKYEILKNRPIARLDYPSFMRKIEPLLGADSTQPITIEGMRGGVPQGTRHHYGIRYATRLIGVEGLDPDAALDVLKRWNQKNTPPMAEYDLERMVNNAVGYVKPQPPGPMELGGERSVEITDKVISDYILDKHSFYCDADDTNTILYVWRGGYWQRGIYEGVINKELSRIFDGQTSRGKMQLEKTITFLRGKAMENTVSPAPPTKVSFKNGLLDITTMELGEHDKNLFIVNQIPHEYTPGAKCPKWIAWLEDTVPHEDIAYLQEWMGYNFYSAVPEAAFTVLTGSGQNGKTVFMRIFVDIIGRKNNTNINLPALTYDTFSRAQMDQKLSNISDDLGNTLIKNAGYLKEVSSGSEIGAQHKFGHPFDFTPYAKITYACNEPPEIRDQSDAIKMRLKIVQFPYTFSKEPTEQQKLARDREELINELEEEIPGIINWMLEGVIRFRANKAKFSTSRSTDEMWQYYQRKSLPVISFIEECIEVTDDDNDKMTVTTLYGHLNQWLDENDVKLKISLRKMLKDLKEQGIVTRRMRQDDQKSLFYGLVCSCAVFQQQLGGSSGNTTPAEYDWNNAQAHSDDRDEQYDEGYPKP